MFRAEQSHAGRCISRGMKIPGRRKDGRSGIDPLRGGSTNRHHRLYRHMAAANPSCRRREKASTAMASVC